MKGKLKKKAKDVEAPVESFIPPPPPMPGDDFAMPVREVVRPDNQLELTEAELEEEIAKMLTANNPAAPKNIARYHMKERCYKFEPMVDQTICHYATDGWLLHKTCEEAKKQLDMEKMEKEAQDRFQAEVHRATGDKPGDDAGEGPDDSKQLRNQFNFSERASQTTYFPLRDRETYTDPPPTATVNGSCTQWEIYDEYIKDLERQKIEESMTAKGKKKGGGGGAAAAAAAAAADNKAVRTDAMKSSDMLRCAKILDRMVNQNMYEEIAMDFKYWEDASDSFRPGEGTLLPLWRFTCDKAKRRQVTGICWSPEYLDMFAVGYGSYDFLKQTSGLVCIFSLKNPSHPEFQFVTDSGVMSLHFHPSYSNLLAVGCYDGSVMVYDIHKSVVEPIYQSSVQTGKHSDPVWQIFWQVDDTNPSLQFTTVSSDGVVNLWTMQKSELSHEPLMELTKPAPPLGETNGDGSGDGAPGAGEKAGGCCMDFSKAPGQDHIYLVGTEEGLVHKCSKAYSSQYLGTYNAHHLAVYAVKWNMLHHSVFLSASADWTVKLWDANHTSHPVMKFDLNDSVGDVAWAPYSSTVFAASTDDGKVHVFDLSQNKLLPVCSQKVVKKAKLTKVVFNPKHPIVLVGDDRGNVTSLKLSPNLRQSSVPSNGEKAEDLEVAKLEAVLEVMRKSEVVE